MRGRPFLFCSATLPAVAVFLLLFCSLEATPFVAAEYPVTQCQRCCSNSNEGDSCQTAFSRGPAHCCGAAFGVSYCCPTDAACVRRGDKWACNRSAKSSSFSQSLSSFVGLLANMLFGVWPTDWLERLFDAFVSAVGFLVFVVFCVVGSALRPQRAPRPARNNKRRNEATAVDAAANNNNNGDDDGYGSGYSGASGDDGGEGDFDAEN